MLLFKQPDLVIIHSAKGSTWEKHKYIKRIDGTYYYPEGYEGGRHLSDLEEADETDEEDSKELSDFKSMLNDLLKKGEAYFDPEELEDMDVDGFRDFYESIMDKDSKGISDKEMKKMLEKFKNEQSSELSDTDVENLAKEVIRGNFGNGQTRKDLLGDNYQEVQDKVNEILRTTAKTTKVSEAPEETVKAGEKAVSKATTSATKASKGIDLEEAWSVYRKKGKQ